MLTATCGSKFDHGVLGVDQGTVLLLKTGVLTANLRNEAPGSSSFWGPAHRCRAGGAPPSGRRSGGADAREWSPEVSAISILSCTHWLVRTDSQVVCNVRTICSTTRSWMLLLHGLHRFHDSLRVLRHLEKNYSLLLDTFAAALLMLLPNHSQHLNNLLLDQRDCPLATLFQNLRHSQIDPRPAAWARRQRCAPEGRPAPHAEALAQRRRCAPRSAP